MKRNKIATAVLFSYGAIQTGFVHFRMESYLASGGPMITVKVV